MNFSPYHKFAGCTRLEDAVDKLRTGGGAPVDLLARHDRYHRSLIHKLRSAAYHVSRLKEYLSTLSTQSTTTAAGKDEQSQPQYIAYRVNFHLDGFLYCVGSSLDIFAQEMLNYFGIPAPSKSTYFGTARKLISKQRPGDLILPFLDEPSWRSEFAAYRNTSTHESIVATKYSVEYDFGGGQEAAKHVIPLPDDPHAAKKTYKRNPDVTVYCDNTFTRTLRLFNPAYKHLADRIKANGNLPL